MPAPLVSHEAFQMLDAIERRGSFAKAAEELNKATSALSYGVQKLEEQLGITVFTRQGRRSVLTPAGQLLLDEGRVILAAAARAAERAREVANGWESRIRIGVEATLDQGKLFSRLDVFSAAHPNIELEVLETLLAGSWELLEHNRVDLLAGAVGPVPAHKGFRTQPMGAAELMAVISRTHPAAESLGRAPDLDHIQRVINHDTVTAGVPRSEGLSLTGQNKLYVQTMEQKLLAIKSGLGVGHLPRHRISSELQTGELLPLPLAAANPPQFLAWQLANTGKGLQALVKVLGAQAW